MIALRMIGWSCPNSEEETTVLLVYSVSLEGVSSHLLSVCTIAVRITKPICRREYKFPVTRLFPELGWVAQREEAMHSCEKAIVFCISYFSVAVGKIPPPKWTREERIHFGLCFIMARVGSWLNTFHPHTGSREKEQEVGAGCKPSMPSLVIDFLQKGSISWRLDNLLKWGPSIQIQEPMGDSSHSKPPPCPSNSKEQLEGLMKMDFIHLFFSQKILYFPSLGYLYGLLSEYLYYILWHGI